MSLLPSLSHTHSVTVISPTLALHQRSNCPVLDYQPSKLWVLYVALAQTFCFSNRERTKYRLGTQLELSSLKKFKNQRLETLSSPQGLHPKLADSLNCEQKKIYIFLLKKIKALKSEPCMHTQILDTCQGWDTDLLESTKHPKEAHKAHMEGNSWQGWAHRQNSNPANQHALSHQSKGFPLVALVSCYSQLILLLQLTSQHRFFTQIFY